MLAVCLGLALLGGQSPPQGEATASVEITRNPAVRVHAADTEVAATVVAHLRAAGYQPSIEEVGPAQHDAVSVTLTHTDQAWEVVGVGPAGVTVRRSVADGDPILVGEALGHVCSAVVASVMDAELDMAITEAVPPPPSEPAVDEPVEVIDPDPATDIEPTREVITEPEPAMQPVGSESRRDALDTAPMPLVPIGMTAGYVGSNYNRAFGWQNALSLRLTGTPRHGYVGGGYDFVAPSTTGELRIRHRVAGVHGGYRWTQGRWDIRAGVQAQLNVAALPVRATRATRRLVLPSIGPEVGVGLLAVGPLRVRARAALVVPLRQPQLPVLQSDPVRVQLGLAFELGNTHAQPTRSATRTARRDPLTKK